MHDAPNYNRSDYEIYKAEIKQAVKNYYNNEMNKSQKPKVRVTGASEGVVSPFADVGSLRIDSELVMQ